jgi:hypothetical protein
MKGIWLNETAKPCRTLKLGHSEISKNSDRSDSGPANENSSGVANSSTMVFIGGVIDKAPSRRHAMTLRCHLVAQL